MDSFKDEEQDPRNEKNDEEARGREDDLGEDEPLEDDPPPVKNRLWLNLLLFVVTVVSTLMAGAMMSVDPEGVTGFLQLLRPENLIQGWPFACTLLLILLCHEMGHYLMARHHGVDASLPYFIPAPSLIGTFGAFIRIRSRISDKKALIDIGAAGPLAGIIVALPVLVVGLALSEVRPMSNMAGGLMEGQSILYALIKKLMLDIGPGEDVFLHPVAFAGWLGLLVTAINLLPIGQLDGGHIAYAILGEGYTLFSKLMHGTLLALGLFGGGATWLVFGAFLFFIGHKHPPVDNEEEPLDGWRRAVAYLTLAILFLTFTPVPLSMIGE